MTKEHHQLDTSLDDKVPIVLVEWHDARFYPDTRDENSIKENCRMSLFASVGYLVSQDDTTTIVASEHNDEQEYRDLTLIPTGSIKSLRRLILGSIV